MTFRAILTLAVAAAPAAAAPSPPPAVLPIDAALARWDMAEARSLAATMPASADRCAVEGIIASRANQIETAAKLLASCLAALERNGSRRAEPVFALERISEALGKEVASFGIRVASLAPGQFRSDRAGRSMEGTARSIDDYDTVIDPIRDARIAKSGYQPGDPARAAQALLALIKADTPPTQLFLGDDALQLVDKKIDAMREEIELWAPREASTAFSSSKHR